MNIMVKTKKRTRKEILLLSQEKAINIFTKILSGNTLISLSEIGWLDEGVAVSESP